MEERAYPAEVRTDGHLTVRPMASEQASRLAITRSGEPGVVPLRDHVLGEFQGGNAE